MQGVLAESGDEPENLDERVRLVRSGVLREVQDLELDQALQHGVEVDIAARWPPRIVDLFSHGSVHSPVRGTLGL